MVLLMAILVNVAFGFGDEFVFVLFTCPLIVFVLSIIGYLFLKKWFIMPIVTLLVFLVLTFTHFNESFMIWVIAYTIISLVVSLLMLVVWHRSSNKA